MIKKNIDTHKTKKKKKKKIQYLRTKKKKEKKILDISKFLINFIIKPIN